MAVATSSGWFSTRSQHTRDRLSNIAKLHVFDAGQSIYRFGDPANGIFGLVSGSFEIMIPRADGMDITIYKADPGYWIGDLAQFSGETRLVSLVAAELTQVLHLPQPELVQLLAEDPRLYADFYELSHVNVALGLRLIANLAIAPSDARIAAHLAMHDKTRADGAYEVQLSQTKLAELVALSVPTVERVLRRLQKEGILELGYGRIRVIDRLALLGLIDGKREQ
ncbi:hypothetical protein BV911_08230 [Pseudoruegeria sp. SK021]|nr:hypothetical protein BV911_08230 [Pseudoruegeria sp. SK021]